MGVSAAIFESAGQRTEHYIPGAYSRSENVSSPSGVSAGNLVILGDSTGGEPRKLLGFSNISEAKATLGGGNLLNAIGFAFNASNTFSPSKIYAMRVNAGTQSSLTLGQLTLKSWDWGTHTNQLKLWLQTGTTTGSKKLTIGYKSNTKTVDNIIRNSLSIVYTGEGTNPKCTITSTGINMSATIEGESGDSFSTTWENTPYLSELVDMINDTGVYTAVLLDTRSNVETAQLDNSASEQSITTAYTFTSTLQALIEELTNIEYIGSVTLSGTTRTVPANTTGYVYFTGGTAGTTTTADWAATLTALETEDVQIIATSSTDNSVHTAIAAHCLSMSNTVNRRERTCWVGGPLNETDSNGITNAKGFNSKYVSYVIDNAQAYNQISGATETITGAMLSVMCAAMESAMAVNNPLTFKDLNLKGIGKKRTNTNMEDLIKAGICVINPNPLDASTYVVIRAVTTYQGSELQVCERSMVREDLYMNRDLRSAFAGGIGDPQNTSESAIVTTLDMKAKEWVKSGMIVDLGSKSVFDISVTFNGDKVYLTYSRYLTAPRNFVFITATNYVYTSTVEI